MVLCSIFESEKQKEESQAEGGSKKEGKKPKRARTSEKGKAIKVLMRMGVSENRDNSWVDEPKIMQVVAKMGLSGVLPSQFMAFLLSLSYQVGHSGDLRYGTHMLCHVPDKLF